MNDLQVEKKRKERGRKTDGTIPRCLRQIPALGQNRTCPMKEVLVVVDVTDKVTSALGAA